MIDEITSKSVEQEAFLLISTGGDATASFLRAIKEAGEGNFDNAYEFVNKGNQALVSAHEMQTALITQEALGNKQEYSLLMVHAQDHLMNAMLLKELVVHIIKLYKNNFKNEE